MDHANRKPVALGLTAALILAVVGCTSSPDTDTPQPQPVDVVFEQVQALGWSDASARGSDFSAVAAVNDVPRLTIASVGASGQPRELKVWAAEPGQMAGAPITITDVTGDVTKVAADGVNDLTAIAGTAWQDGQYSSYLVTSADRATWTSVELPNNVSASRITEVAVPNPQMIVVAGNGFLGREQQLSVLDLEANTWTTFSLPAPSDADAQTITGLDVSHSRIVVTMSTGPEGELSTPVSFMSNDMGVTFTGPHPIAPEGSSVAGVVWASNTFVATGGVRGDDGNSQPAAWAAADGVTWKDEAGGSIKWSDGENPLAGIDTKFGPPLESSGSIGVGASGTSLAGVYFTGREADGTWYESAGGTSSVLTNGPSFLVVPDRGSNSVVVTGGHNGLRELRWNDSTQDFDVNDLIVATSPFQVDSAEPGDGAINLQASSSRFTWKADGGWTSARVSRFGQFTSDGISDRPWGPSAMAGSERAVAAVDSETGTTVVAATLSDEGRFQGAAWFKSSGGEWEPATGFDGGAFRYVATLERLDTGWFLAAVDAVDASFDTARPVTIWASSDGAAWTPTAEGLSADGANEAWVSDLCSDGQRTVAVGSTSTIAGVSTATWWYSDGGEWTKGTLESAGASFSSCEATDGTFVVTGSLNGRTATWTSTDLTQFTSQSVLDRGLSRGDPVQAGDRWVAGGSVETEDYSGPVLWVSADGVEWSWIRVPVTTSSGLATVQAEGDLVAVLVDGLDGVEAWRVVFP